MDERIRLIEQSLGDVPEAMLLKAYSAMLDVQRFAHILYDISGQKFSLCELLRFTEQFVNDGKIAVDRTERGEKSPRYFFGITKRR